MQLGFYLLAVIVALVLQTHLVFHDVSVVWHVDLALGRLKTPFLGSIHGPVFGTRPSRPSRPQDERQQRL